MNEDHFNRDKKQSASEAEDADRKNTQEYKNSKRKYDKRYAFVLGNNVV